MYDANTVYPPQASLEAFLNERDEDFRVHPEHVREVVEDLTPLYNAVYSHPESFTPDNVRALAEGYLSVICNLDREHEVRLQDASDAGEAGLSLDLSDGQSTYYQEMKFVVEGMIGFLNEHKPETAALMKVVSLRLDSQQTQQTQQSTLSKFVGGSGDPQLLQLLGSIIKEYEALSTGTDDLETVRKLLLSFTNQSAPEGVALGRGWLGILASPKQKLRAAAKEAEAAGGGAAVAGGGAAAATPIDLSNLVQSFEGSNLQAQDAYIQALLASIKQTNPSVLCAFNPEGLYGMTNACYNLAYNYEATYTDGEFSSPENAEYLKHKSELVLELYTALSRTNPEHEQLKKDCIDAAELVTHYESLIPKAGGGHGSPGTDVGGGSASPRSEDGFESEDMGELSDDEDATSMDGSEEAGTSPRAYDAPEVVLNPEAAAQFALLLEAAQQAGQEEEEEEDPMNVSPRTGGGGNSPESG